MKQETLRIRKQFAERTGLKVLGCHLNPGSMKEFVSVIVESAAPDIVTLVDSPKPWVLHGIQVTYIDSEYNGRRNLSIKLDQFHA